MGSCSQWSFLWLLPLLMSWLTRAQQTLSWPVPLPTGYQLINGDLLRIPLDDYVSLNGAMIQTNDPLGRQVIQKMQLLATVNFSQPSIAQFCRTSQVTQSNLYLICMNKYFVKLDLNPQTWTVSNFVKTDLTATSLSSVNQICTDIFIDGSSKAYVPCYDSIGSDTNIYLFEITLASLPSVGRVNYCFNQNGVKGNLKLTKVSYGASNWQFIIFDSSLPQVTPGAVYFMRCAMNPDTSTNTNSNTVGSYNLATLIGDTNLNASLRYVQGLLNTDMLYVISKDDSTYKGLVFGVLSLDQTTGNLVNNTAYNYTKYPMSHIPNVQPHYISGVSPVMNSLVFIDKLNLHSLSISNVKSTTPYTISINSNWTVPFDCGLSSTPTVYVGKITNVGGALSDYTTRLSVEYRFNSTHELKEAAIHYNQTKYGCSRTPGFADGAIQTFGVVNSNIAVSTKYDQVSFYKISPDFLLNVSINNVAAPMNNTIQITASMQGYTSSSISYTYQTFPTSADLLNVTLTVPTVKAYSGTKFMLPVAPYNFLVDAPTFTTNNSNVSLLYSSSQLFSQVVNLTNGYTVFKIMAIDVDTFVAVLRKSGSPEGYSLFFTNGTGPNMTILGNPATMTTFSSDGLYVFKAAKVANHVCLFLKGGFTIFPKLQVTCSVDGVGGTSSLGITNMGLANTVEVNDMEFYETSSKLEVLIVATDTTSGTASQTLLYYVFTIVNNVPTFTASPVSLTYATPLLAGYQIIDAMFDFWADSEGNIFLTAMLISSNDAVLARYVMTYNAGIPSLTFSRFMKVDRKAQSFCINKNEVILYDQRRRLVFSQRWDKFNTAGAGQSRLVFPLIEFAVQGVIQTNCIPEKGIFQVLAFNSTNKMLINFRGGESTLGSRRVHSVMVLENGVNFIETAFTTDYIMTVGSVPGDTTINRNFVFTYTSGPFFVVDNSGATNSYNISITTSNRKSSTQNTMQIEVIKPTLMPTTTPNRVFTLDVGKTIFLGDEATIDGPVMDVVLSGSDQDKISLTRRKNPHRKYNTTGAFSSLIPDRMFTEKDYMVHFFKNQGVMFFGDPSATSVPNAVQPTPIYTLNGQVKDIFVVPYGIADEAIAIVKLFANGVYQYNVYCLSKTISNGVPTYTYSESANLYSTTIDYDTLTAGTVDNDAVFMSLSSSKSYVSNYLQLVSFKKNTNAIFTKQAEARAVTSESREIGRCSLIYNGKGVAILIGNYKGYAGLIVANWDLLKPEVRFVSSSTLFSWSATDQRSVFINYIKCYYKNTLKADCIVDSEGIVDYLFEVTLTDMTVNPNADPVGAVTKMGEFEMPPGYAIQKIDRGIEHYAFLLKKSQANVVSRRRRLQSSGTTVDPYDTCNSLIALYSPFRSKYIYTAITCSEFGNLDTVDYSVEWAGQDYIYFTKNPTTSGNPPITDNTKIASYYLSPLSVRINEALDPKQVIFTFVGLLGSNAVATNNILTLNNFRLGQSQTDAAPDYSFWYWVLGFGGLILVVVGIGYLYIKFSNTLRNSTAISESTYKKTSDSPQDKDKTSIDLNASSDAML